jgi:hypothetical protein
MFYENPSLVRFSERMSLWLPGAFSFALILLSLAWNPRWERQSHSVTFLHLDLLSLRVDLPAGVNRAAQFSNVVLYDARFHFPIQGCNSNVYTDSYLIRTCARMLRA